MSQVLNQYLKSAPALLGAFLLAGSAASLAAVYGWQQGASHGPEVAAIFAAAAIGGSILAPFAVDEAIRALGRFELGRGTACALLACICIAYSSAAALSFASATRGDTSAARSLAAGNVAAALAERDRVTAELSTLATARPTKAATERRDGLEATLRGVNATLLAAEAAHRSVGDADPLAKSLAVYGTALGWTATAGQVAPWLALLSVAFLEVGAGLSVFVARCVVARDVSQAPVAAPPAAVLAPVASEMPPAQSAAQRPEKGPDRDDDTPPAPPKRGVARLIEALQAQGGHLEGSTREIAARLGGGKSTVHRQIAELVAGGRVRATVTTRGTRLELA